MKRPFRFGLQAFEGSSAGEWFDTVRRAEDLGYDALFSSDHYFGPGAIATATGHRPVDMAPLTSIAMAAARTTTLRVGCRVFCCDFHHPVVLAKEMATLDVLSEGRLIVGLGAGWVRDEYDGLGVTMERPSVRIAKLAEYVDVMRAHWSGAELDVHGSFVDVSGFSGLPKPVQPSGPPIMIGGGAPKILGLAGRVADIVSLNFNNASGSARQFERDEFGRRRDRGEDLVDSRRGGRSVRPDRDRDRGVLRRCRRRSRRPARRDGCPVRRRAPTSSPPTPTPSSARSSRSASC